MLVHLFVFAAFIKAFLYYEPSETEVSNSQLTSFPSFSSVNPQDSGKMKRFNFGSVWRPCLNGAICIHSEVLFHEIDINPIGNRNTKCLILYFQLKNLHIYKIKNQEKKCKQYLHSIIFKYYISLT